MSTDFPTIPRPEEFSQDNVLPQTPVPAPLAVEPSPQSDSQQPRLSVIRWIWEGLRISLLLRPRRLGQSSPGPLQMLLLVALSLAIELTVDRHTYIGEVNFRLDGLLASGSVVLLTLWCSWCAMPRESRNDGSLAAWFALQCWALLPVILLASVWLTVDARRDEPVESPILYDASMMLLLLLWSGTIVMRLGRLFYGSWARAFFFVVGSSSLALALYLNINADYWELIDEGAQQTQSEDQADESSDEGDGADADESTPDDHPEYLEARLRSWPVHGV